MGFLIFMLCMSLFIPVLYLIIGKLFMNNAPNNINYVYGYRTKMSMKNQETWDFAHRIMSKFCIKTWLPLAIASLIPYIFIYGASDYIIGISGVLIIFTQIIYMFVVIVYVEKALKDNFDKEGNRRIKES